MDDNHIKTLVQAYNSISMDDIEEIIKYIVTRENSILGMECNLSIEYEEGGSLRDKATKEDKYSLQIGIYPLSEIKEQKEAIHYGIKNVNLEDERTLLQNEKQEFIELILQIFHELRHLEQNYSIVERPVFTEDTLRMIQEKIIDNAFPGLMSVYNYETSKLEIDAMMTSLYKTVIFFKEMELDITPDEIFEVMKHKELIHLNYERDFFGNTFASAINYFNQIYYVQSAVHSFEKAFELLNETEKTQFHEQCQDLYLTYKTTTSAEDKWNILVSMALIMKPELYDKYHLLHPSIPHKR